MNYLVRYKFIFGIVILSLSLNNGHAQSFEGAIVIGGNFSQLEGDNLSGFNKLGLHSGLRLSYPINEQRGFATELLYNQKGSDTGIIQNQNTQQQSLTLQYLSIPLYYYFKEWWIEEKEDYMFRIQIGPSINRLFGVKSTNSFFDNATDDFADWDFGLSVGIAYQLTKKISIESHYERSITKVYHIPNSNLSGLQSYLVNIRMGYKL